MKSIVRIVLSMFLVLPAVSAFAQEPENHVFTLSTFKMHFNRVAEYLEFYEKELKPQVAQNEFVLSQRVMTHAWGPDWSLIIISEYKDMATIQAFQKRATEIAEKRTPDKAKRDEMSARFADAFLGHTDAIVLENAKLRK